MADSTAATSVVVAPTNPTTVNPSTRHTNAAASMGSTVIDASIKVGVNVATVETAAAGPAGGDAVVDNVAADDAAAEPTMKTALIKGEILSLNFFNLQLVETPL